MQSENERRESREKEMIGKGGAQQQQGEMEKKKGKRVE